MDDRQKVNQRIKVIPSCIAATGQAVASGNISPDRAGFFLKNLVEDAWDLIEEARKHER